MSQRIAHAVNQPVHLRFAAGRYEALDGLRGVLALCVVFHHYFLFCGYQWFSKAWVAVDVFFLMSGLVLTSAYHARFVGGLSAGSFLRQRFLRLYPLYLGSFIYAVSVYLLVGGRDQIKIALGVFLIPALSGGGGHDGRVIFPINDPSWSLFFEIWGGLVFAALYRILFPARRLLIATFLLFLSYLLVLAFMGLSPGWSPQSFWGGWIRVLFYMMLGRLIWEYRSILPRVSSNAWFALLAVFLVGSSITTKYVFPVLFVSGVVLVATGLVLRPGHGGMGRGISLYLGRVSYPLYLVHYPTWFLVTHWVGKGAYLESIVLGTLLSVVLADAMSRLDELLQKRIKSAGLLNR